MTDIEVKKNEPRTSLRTWDPFRVMQDLVAWDPFAGGQRR